MKLGNILVLLVGVRRRYRLYGAWAYFCYHSVFHTATKEVDRLEIALLFVMNRSLDPKVRHTTSRHKDQAISEMSIMGS
jgi:hypothetical protein